MNKPSDIRAVATVPLWIDRKPQAATSVRRADVTNPATGAVTRQVPLCNAGDIDRAVAAARRAYPRWRDTPPLRRARILMRFRELLDAHRDELARLAGWRPTP